MRPPALTRMSSPPRVVRRAAEPEPDDVHRRAQSTECRPIAVAPPRRGRRRPTVSCALTGSSPSGPIGCAPPTDRVVRSTDGPGGPDQPERRVADRHVREHLQQVPLGTNTSRGGRRTAGRSRPRDRCRRRRWLASSRTLRPRAAARRRHPARLVEQRQCRRVHGVAPEVSQEVGMLFQTRSPAHLAGRVAGRAPGPPGHRRRCTPSIRWSPPRPHDRAWLRLARTRVPSASGLSSAVGPARGAGGGRYFAPMYVT